jgi:hypothetical protein
MADITHNFGSSFQAIRPSLGPTITFLGSTDIELVVNGDFVDFGADARDSKNKSNRGGYTVDTTGLDMNTPGTYTIKYVAYDLVGRKTEVTRNVVVKLGDAQVSSSSLRTLGDLNQDGTTDVFALMHPSTSGLNAKPVYDYQGSGVLANSDLAGITIDNTLLDLNPSPPAEQLFIKVKQEGESHTLNLINSTSSALMLSSDIGLLIKDFTGGKSTVNFTTQTSGYSGEVVTLTAEAITINIAHGSSSHTLIDQLKTAYVAQGAEPTWGFSLVDFIAEDTGGGDGGEVEIQPTTIDNIVGSGSESYQNVFGDTVLNDGTTTAFNESYSDAITSKPALTFAPIVDTSTIATWESNSNISSGAFPLESATNNSGYEINRVNLAKYSDDQVNGEGYDYASDTEPVTTYFKNDYSSPLVFLENDAQTGVALVFKRVSQLSIKIGSDDPVAPDRIYTPADLESVEDTLSSNSDMTDGQLLFVSTGSVYVRNSSQNGDGTTSFYSGWDDPAYASAVVEISGRYPDRFRWSIGQFADSAIKSSVELEEYGEVIHLKIDYSAEVTIKQIVQGVVDSYNTQTGDKTWDFSLVRVTDTGYASV